jgi:hypothetical protein
MRGLRPKSSPRSRGECDARSALARDDFGGHLGWIGAVSNNSGSCGQQVIVLFNLRPHGCHGRGDHPQDLKRDHPNREPQKSIDTDNRL